MTDVPVTDETTTADVEQKILDAVAKIREHWHELLEIPEGGRAGSPSTDTLTVLERRLTLRQDVDRLLADACRLVIRDRPLTTVHLRHTAETDRMLRLTGASPEDVEHIDDMLYMLVEFEKEPGYRFERHLRQLGDYMRTVTRKCLGKRASYPTLYSLRHQFAANAKSSYTQSEVAALMGHGVDVTATIHYGRRASGQGALKVAPLPAQVATVRNHPKASSRVRSARRTWDPARS